MQNTLDKLDAALYLVGNLAIRIILLSKTHNLEACRSIFHAFWGHEETIIAEQKDVGDKVMQFCVLRHNCNAV